MRGPIYVTELGFRGRSVGMHIEREREFQEFLGFVPIDIDIDVERPGSLPQRDSLHDTGIPERTCDDQCVVHDRDRICPGQVGHGVPVEAIDIPGIPLVGRVSVQLQQVSGCGHGFASADSIDERDQQAVGVEGSGNSPVVQPESARRRGGSDRARPIGDGCAQRGHPIASVWRGIEDQLPSARTRQGSGRGFDDGLKSVGDRRVVALGVLVHPGDGAAGQDVVELLQQHQLPDLVELGVRVFEAGAHRGRGRPQLGLAQ
ncbi:Uncharacterised protein [Mycobacteroides abscessus subsp. abscessus]|nr:Uncharacterised protein [Mycobacteroides abscessus subsp. abscessus]